MFSTAVIHHITVPYNRARFVVLNVDRKSNTLPLENRPVARNSRYAREVLK